MPPSTFVAIDIETTGLDPEKDHVTEVGLVRFDESGAELETFQSFVNPGREIPLFIQNMTGVTTGDVATAPTLKQLAAKLREFAGGDPVIGHNVGFDLGYLRRGGVNFTGAAIDTAQIARFLYPSLRGRGLVDLANELGVQADAHHRALNDARTAARLFVALRGRAAGLPPLQRKQLARVVALQDEGLAGAIFPGGDAGEGLLERPMVRPAPHYPKLEPYGGASRVDIADVERVLGSAASVLDRFEERPQQRQMASFVLETVRDGGQLLCEAGTGVGKSFAYLVPAALHAYRTGKRVVVSTNTIGLQEQLLKKDIPALREMLTASGEIESPDDFRAVLLKGRGNYLCLQRWTASFVASAMDPDFARIAASMLLWLPETETGDRTEIGLDSVDWLTWQRLSAQDADCLSRQNTYVREGLCFLQRARKAAESAHIIVVNHALLLADLASGGSAIPDYDILIIDEAHNLEETATRQFGSSVTRRQLQDALDAMYRPASRDHRNPGGIAEFLKAFPGGTLKEHGEQLREATEQAFARVPEFSAALLPLLPRGRDEDRLLITGAVRSSPDWDMAEIAAGEFMTLLRAVSARAQAAVDILSRGSSRGARDDDAEDAGDGSPGDVLAGEIESAIRRIDDVRANIASILGTRSDDTIAWLARDGDAGVSLHNAPLEVGTTLQEELWDHCEAVIATSATLATGRDAKYVARQLGLDEARFEQLGSPFDYERSTLLAAVTDLPEPSDRSYNAAAADAIAQLVLASEGRALALFTSHSALREVARIVREPLEAQGIAVLAQGIDGYPARLAQQLVDEPRSLILGTSSFWEGVDIRGEALSLLIITRLPFAVPTDPIYQARSALHNNPFGDYSLPAAVLRFRQGFGRLIRDSQDRGVVAVLDRRIFSKGYGETFATSIPRCTRLKGDVELVAERTRDWLAAL